MLTAATVTKFGNLPVVLYITYQEQKKANKSALSYIGKTCVVHVK